MSVYCNSLIELTHAALRVSSCNALRNCTNGASTSTVRVAFATDFELHCIPFAIQSVSPFWWAIAPSFLRKEAVVALITVYCNGPFTPGAINNWEESRVERSNISVDKGIPLTVDKSRHFTAIRCILLSQCEDNSEI